MKDIKKKIDKITIKITAMIKELNKYDGIIVKCPGGKYKGRNSKVSGFIYDHKGMYCLLYVLHSKTGEILNSDTDSRRYWPINDIDFTISKRTAKIKKIKQ